MTLICIQRDARLNSALLVVFVFTLVALDEETDEAPEGIPLHLVLSWGCKLIYGVRAIWRTAISFNSTPITTFLAVCIGGSNFPTGSVLVAR